jgi:hypothetical protein
MKQQQRLSCRRPYPPPFQEGEASSAVLQPFTCTSETALLQPEYQGSRIRRRFALARETSLPIIVFLIAAGCLSNVADGQRLWNENEIALQ